MPMSVFKLIIRLDFPIVYEILDRIGTCCAILNRGREDFWQAAGMLAGGSGALANYRSNDEYRHISIEATAFIILWESYPGIDLSKLLTVDTFQKFDEMFAEFSKIFAVDRINRAGFRILATSENNGGKNDRFEKAKGFIAGEQVNLIQKNLGMINNLAVTFEGTTESKSQYRLSYGPYSQDEPFKYYERLVVPNNSRKNTDGYFTFDLDLFETMISLKGTSLRRWARPKWVSASDLFEKTLRLVVADRGEC
jgi:hypothetical protein